MIFRQFSCSKGTPCKQPEQNETSYIKIDSAILAVASSTCDEEEEEEEDQGIGKLLKVPFSNYFYSGPT